MPAQTIPQAENVDSAVNTILAQGVLGALVVLLAVAFFIAIRGWLQEKDGRRTDQREMAKTLEGINLTLRDLVVEGNKHASNLVIEATRSQDGIKNALQNQERALENMQEALDLLRQEQLKLNMILTQGKK